MANKGGFSWKRATGVTRQKQRIARATGIPLTKSGRQRKVGKAVTGGGCLVPTLLIVFALLAAACGGGATPVPVVPFVGGASPTPTIIGTPRATPLATEPPAMTKAPPTPVPTATPAPAKATATPAPVVYYASCADARAAGAAPLYRGQPGYRAGLDRDNDGVACE